MGCKCPPPAWVLLPPQLEYYYPSSLSTTTLPAWVLLPPQLEYYYPPSFLSFTPGWNSFFYLSWKLVTRKDCCILSSRRRWGGDHALSLSIYFTEPGLFYILLSVLGWFEGWCYCTTLSRCHPPRYCDFLEELVVDDGIKILDLHLRATCRVRSAAYFDSLYFRSSYYCVYRQSHPSKIMYYMCSK